MSPVRRRAVLAVFFIAFGCHSQNTPSEAVAGQLRTIAAAGTLSDLAAPNFPDYRQQVQALYKAVNYSPVWLRDGQPTPQALAVIAALEASRQKGLTPEDYDASRWTGRLLGLKNTPGDAVRVAHFDAALAVCAMRYISDVHIGRVNPKHFKLGFDVAQKSYDLPQFLLQEVLMAGNVAQVLHDAEPPYFFYQRTEAALDHYLVLAEKENRVPLPEVQKTVAPGDAYSGSEALAQRLQLLGDLPTGSVNATPGIYGGPMVDAVKHFQGRHGLTPDGQLGKDTLRQLNVPLSSRIDQLDDALERWRWLPVNFSPLPVLVNVPEFVLRVFNPDHSIAMRMNVIVGKALRHATPVFAQDMKYIVLRPYWNVPLSITRAEIIPSLEKDGGYLARKS
jgi:L,D-transpeptidase YcbB